MAHIFLYFLALLSLSTASIWAKLNHMAPEVLGFYRMFGAGIILFTYLFIRRNFKSLKLDFKFDSSMYWALGSAFFFFLHLWTYKYASKNTLVSNMMILFATNPIWASLGGQIFFKENIKPRVILAYMLAVIGVFILVAQNLQLSSDNHLGNISALVSAFFYAGYMLTSKKARLHMNNEQYALIQYSITALLFLLASFFTGANLTGYDSISWGSVLGLILIPTFLGHFSFTYLVKHMNLGFMTCGKLIEPVIATMIAYLTFGEAIGINALYAFFFTGLSVIVLFWPTLTKRTV